jgi:hypothetical protein
MVSRTRPAFERRLDGKEWGWGVIDAVVAPWVGLEGLESAEVLLRRRQPPARSEAAFRPSQSQ